MSESEERNKRLMAEAEQIETESREVAEEAWAEVDPRAVQLASDIRSVVEENRRLREALEALVNHPGPCSKSHKGCAAGRRALGWEAL